MKQYRDFRVNLYCRGVLEVLPVFGKFLVVGDEDVEMQMKEEKIEEKM